MQQLINFLPYVIFFLNRRGERQVLLRKAKPWTIVGNVFGECDDPCTLNTYFVDLKNNNGHILSPTTD
jgi:hypothetical protein